MARYLFFIRQPYSQEILRPLQREIRRCGGDVRWYYHGVDPALQAADEELLHSVAAVKRFDPLAVFVPGKWVPDFFPGTKVQVFHGLANDRTGKPGHFRVRGLFDLYCTHGEDSTSTFRQLAQQHGFFHVAETGWPKLDPLFQRGPADDELEREIPSGRPVVLYAATFSPSLTSAPVLIDWLAQQVDDSPWHWLVTMHPKVDPQLVQRYRDLAGPNLTFRGSEAGVLSLLRRADAMLCDTSSIALEFLLLDKPLVTFRNKSPGPQMFNVTEPTAIRAALQQALRRPEAQLQAARSYVDRLHPYRDGQSSQRVLAATHDFIDNHAAALKPKPLNLWRKLQIRSELQYYRLR